MLEEYKDLCRKAADQLPGWREMSKNELCNMYVDSEDKPLIQNACFGALMYKYWHLIAKYYYMSSNVASWEDCYNWLEESLYYGLKDSRWKDKDSSIYKDPNGPDKVINRCMKCSRLTYYQFINRKKRQDNFGMLSLDELAEAFGNGVAEPTDYYESNKTYEWVLFDYIKSIYLKKDYFVAFLLDCIICVDVFDTVTSEQKENNFNLRKLVKFLSSIDTNNEYIEDFAYRYKLPKTDVLKATSYISSLSTTTLKRKVELAFMRLQHDSFFKALHDGGINVN